MPNFTMISKELWVWEPQNLDKFPVSPMSPWRWSSGEQEQTVGRLLYARFDIDLFESGYRL